jgi:hypothetical protein
MHPCFNFKISKFCPNSAFVSNELYIREQPLLPSRALICLYWRSVCFPRGTNCILRLIYLSSNICTWCLAFTFSKQLNICPSSLPSFKHVQSNSNPTNRVSRSLRKANHRRRQFYSILSVDQCVRLTIHSSSPIPSLTGRPLSESIYP